VRGQAYRLQFAFVAPITAIITERKSDEESIKQGLFQEIEKLQETLPTSRSNNERSRWCVIVLLPPKISLFHFASRIKETDLDLDAIARHVIRYLRSVNIKKVRCCFGSSSTTDSRDEVSDHERWEKVMKHFLFLFSIYICNFLCTYQSISERSARFLLISKMSKWIIETRSK